MLWARLLDHVEHQIVHLVNYFVDFIEEDPLLVPALSEVCVVKRVLGVAEVDDLLGV